MNTTVIKKSSRKQMSVSGEKSLAKIRRDGWNAFLALRAEAQENGTRGMSLEEINAEIALSRRGK